MKFNLTNKDILEIKGLFETLDSNIDIANLYIDFLTEIQNENYLKKIDKEMHKYFAPNFVYHNFLKFLQIDKNDSHFKVLENKHELYNFEALDPRRYSSNAYYKNIKLSGEASKNNWEIKYLNYQPYELFVYKDTTFDYQFNEITHLGYFPERFTYLAVIQNDTIWMSLTPNEIETMQESIDNAYGNVITYGLGLGYFPYMCSLKRDVKSITIIEKDQNAIDLFKQNILPQFNFKDKIKIVLADAFDYEEDSKFDYAFVDLWHTVDDGVEMYIKMLQKENKDNKTVYSYWIEDSLIALIRRYIITFIYEIFYKENVDYSKADNFNDKLINSLYEYYKDTNINSCEEIYKMIEKDNIINTLKKIKI